MSDQNKRLTERFAVRLEETRKTYGRGLGRPRVTMAQFAEALGIAAATYRRYERAEMQPPLEVLAKLRLLTGVSLDWLIAEQSGRTATVGREGVPVRRADLPGWPKYLSRDEAARYLGVSIDAFDDEVRSGLWPAGRPRGGRGSRLTWNRTLLDAIADALDSVPTAGPGDTAPA
jgi:transcriptional regulator with XRE-family HTH domain